jgi:hypothetical protein
VTRIAQVGPFRADRRVLGVGVSSLGAVNAKAADLYRDNLVPSSHLAAMNQSGVMPSHW